MVRSEGPGGQKRGTGWSEAKDRVVRSEGPGGQKQEAAHVQG